jgi:hypothetical protein
MYSYGLFFVFFADCFFGSCGSGRDGRTKRGESSAWVRIRLLGGNSKKISLAC